MLMYQFHLKNYQQGSTLLPSRKLGRKIINKIRHVRKTYSNEGSNEIALVKLVSILISLVRKKDGPSFERKVLLVG